MKKFLLCAAVLLLLTTISMPTLAQSPRTSHSEHVWVERGAGGPRLVLDSIGARRVSERLTELDMRRGELEAARRALSASDSLLQVSIRNSGRCAEELSAVRRDKAREADAYESIISSRNREYGRLSLDLERERARTSAWRRGALAGVLAAATMLAMMLIN